MNNLQIFDNKEFGQIRVIEQNGEPWFVAKDVCSILEIKNSRDAMSRLEDDEKGVVLTDTLGGNQEVSTVNEYGLYSLVIGSRKPEAKQFKRWITHDVIPAIRKHGGYLTEDKMAEALLNPDTIIQLATNLKEEQAKRRQAERLIEEQKPKVLFADAVSTSKQSCLIGELAKVLKQNGVDIGQNRLFEILRNNGYLGKSGERRNLPTQYSMELGLMEIKKTTINNPDGSVRVTSTPKITGKGQQYFINKFLNVA